MVIDFLAIRHKFDFPIYLEALTCNSPVITAVANDIGYEFIFSRQLEIKLTPRDLCILISASGESANLLYASSVVRQKGAQSLAFLGFNGGKLKEKVDNYFLVATPQGEYGIVEDIHLSLVHATAEILKDSSKALGRPDE
jgi:D-sedoheptulose 7-phosphate isomerase